MYYVVYMRYFANSLTLVITSLHFENRIDFPATCFLFSIIFTVNAIYLELERAHGSSSSRLVQGDGWGL